MKGLQMHVDPQGRGMFLLKDGHLVCQTASQKDSADLFFRDDGFSLFLFHADSQLDYVSVDSDGDGIPNIIRLRHGEAEEIRRRIQEIKIESE